MVLQLNDFVGGVDHLVQFDAGNAHTGPNWDTRRDRQWSGHICIEVEAMLSREASKKRKPDELVPELMTRFFGSPVNFQAT